MRTIILLAISNLFMNLAWYGHLKFRNYALWMAILVSWGIALFEYIFLSSGESHRFIRVDCAAAKSAAGMHHADRLHARCFRTLPFAGAVELPRFLRAHCRRGLFRV
jgi:hypothetical protein